MILRRFGSRRYLIGSAFLVACMFSFSMQGCSGPVAKVNRAERKVDQAEGMVDTKREDAEDTAGNRASEVDPLSIDERLSRYMVKHNILG